MFFRAPSFRSRFPQNYLVLISTLVGALMQPIHANSAALGDASVRSVLGQRLDAEVDIASLTVAEAESVSVKLAPPALWASAGIDLGTLQRSLRLSVEKKEGRYRVRIASDLAVNEPFMHLLIELSASGVRTIRQYVLLIDPPVLITAPDTITNVRPSNATSNATSNAASNAATTADSPAAASTSVAAGAAKASLPTAPDEEKTADPSSDQRYRVKPGESLRSIAQQMQPGGVQLEQVMLSLLNRNPDAFIGNNLHRLRSGSLLTLPAAESIRAIEPEKARQTLRVQTADFLRYQRQLAERSAARAGTTAVAQADPAPKANLQSSAGSVSVKMTEPAASPVAQDKLTLSASGGTEVASKSVSSREAVEKVASDKALADANARIAALEKNIGDMQALLEMKSHALSEAQQRAEQTPAVLLSAEKAPPSASSPAVPLAPTAPTAPTAPAVQTAPTRVTTAASTPVQTSSTIAEDVFALAQLDPIIGAGVAIVLLVLALLWRRHRSKIVLGEGLAPSPIEPTMSPTVIGESGGRQIDTAHSVFHSNFVPSLSQIDMNEVDAVAEADVYIAYGRDEQAEEILLDALRAHPERHALRVKLLEIYEARSDHQRFGTLAAELRLLTYGQGPDWVRAAQIGQSFEPDNHMYKSVTSSVDAAAASVPRSQNGSNPYLSRTNVDGLVANEALGSKAVFRERMINDKAINDKLINDKPMNDTSHVIDFSLEPIATQSAPLTARMAPVTQGPISSSVLRTKLELALACKEIGDHAGARDLLTEVANARDPELAQRAQALLLQLA
jgi:pilus assembly protein FimV